jgi:hypothetical protein
LPPINSVLTCDYDLIFPQMGWVFQSLPNGKRLKMYLFTIFLGLKKI